MKIVLGVVFIIALSLLALDVNAASRLRDYTTIGDQACKEWNKNARDAEDPDNLGASIRHASDRAWMVGYASGINRAWYDDDLLRDIDYYLLNDWTDRYCRSNPDKSVGDAIGALFKRLKRLP